MKKEIYDNSVKILLDESKYYDKEKIEIKSILKSISLNNKEIVDVGAGVGRLALPLVRYAKNIIALDSNDKLKNYYKTIKNPKLKFICSNAEKYLKSRKSDIFIFAWPSLNKRLVRVIKKSMHSKSRLIVFIPKDNSDYESIVEKIGVFNKRESMKHGLDKKQFLVFLEQEFEIVKKKLLKTRYTYKNKFIAFDGIKENIEFWFNLKLKVKQLDRLKRIVRTHNNDNRKVVFSELVYFYILKNKKQ